jgi:hypothetical protein
MSSIIEQIAKSFDNAEQGSGSGRVMPDQFPDKKRYIVCRKLPVIYK